MRATELAVLRAAADGGVVLGRYANKAHASATGKTLSVAAVRRAINACQLRRHPTCSVNFHYEITDTGLEALRNVGGLR